LVSKPSSFFVLLVGVRAITEEEVCAVHVAEGDRVEEGGAAIVVGNVDVCTTKTHKSLNAFVVTPGVIKITFLLLDFGPGQLTRFMFILSYEAVF
jgi:hypothetical protein